MSPSNWIRLQLTVSETHSEIVASLLWDLETCGFEEAVRDSTATLVAYFPPSQTVEGFQARLAKRLKQLEIAPFQTQVSLMTFAPQEAIRKWQNDFTGFPVGKTFYIHPGWETAPSQYPIPILMEPGHAFGSGTHESTQLALSLLALPCTEARSILDVGTGSGILLIAASRLSKAKTLVGLDVDPHATETAALNLQRNRVGGALLVSGEPVCLRGGFDLVLANLTSPVICRLLPELSRLTRRHLVLSGFTGEQRDQLVHAWRNAPFGIRHETTLNGWSALLLHRED